MSKRLELTNNGISIYNVGSLYFQGDSECDEEIHIYADCRKGCKLIIHDMNSSGTEVVTISGTIEDKTTYKYDSEGREIYKEYPNGDWIKTTWHSSGQIQFVENSDGKWAKWEYDDDGIKIRYSDSNGV